MSTIHLRLVMATLFWGGTFVAGRLISRELEPFSAAFLRFALASLVLLPILVRREGGLPRLTARQWLAVGLLGLSGVFAYNLFFFYGLQTVEAGRAALIIAANPVFIALFSFLLFGERFTLLKIAGVVISVLGAMTVISRGHLGLLLQGDVGRGELYLLGCVFSWVAYTLIGKRVLSGLSPLAAVSYSASIGALLLLPFAIESGGLADLPTLSNQALLGLLYLSLFGTVLGFVWFYQGVLAIGPTRAGQFINLVPVSGVALGALLLGESLSLSLLTGGLLVLLGLWLTSRSF